MNERFSKTRADVMTFWLSRTKKQKNTYLVSLLSIFIIAGILTFFLSRTEYVSLYQDVSSAEIGRIKEQLDSQGIPSKVAPGGTSILVPKKRADELRVTLAAAGFPNSGTIDYSFITDKSGFGMTDNEFRVMNLAALQNELGNMLKGIEGVKDANVMLTLPTQSVFLNDTVQQATAAIVLKTNPGHQFTEPQINALFNLVSKSLPNLAKEDISIMNQYSEYFDLTDADKLTGPSITDQMAVKKSIERDIQRQVQMMLGTMMGQEKVIVSVTTDIDFKQENREESLVTPVDEENMEGIALSVQRITESFTGNAPVTGGILEGQDPTDNGTGYMEGGFSNGDYEKIEETINNEVNRIRKEIIESPYKVRDIGIQVMVEPPVADDVASMPAELQDDIEQILATIIRTSIDKEAAGPLSEADLSEKIVVSVQPFNGKVSDFESPNSIIPWWIYVVGGVLLLIIVLLVVGLIRNKRRAEADEEKLIIEEQQQVFDIEDINVELETEGTLRRKQLEKMAKDKPEEFAKLLRTWITED
ncbi:flagellar basal-body MS-ring/collar protein FliF [Sporosarcina sp. CAU 1771]